MKDEFNSHFPASATENINPIRRFCQAKKRSRVRGGKDVLVMDAVGGPARFCEREKGRVRVPDWPAKRKEQSAWSLEIVAGKIPRSWTREETRSWVGEGPWPWS